LSQVAIAGAGIVGMSLAWRLSQAGFTVTVYDKGTVGGEASWAGAGMLAPGGEYEDDSPAARLAIESRSLYPAFVRELEKATRSTIDLQETGALDLAYSDAELQALAKRADMQRRIGIEAKRLDAKQIRTFWPRLRTEELAGGYFYSGDAVVNPREVVSALRKATLANGVQLREGSAVLEARVEHDLVIIRTEAGESSQAAFVVAAGAWSGSISLQGVPPLPKSEPIRGHLLGYQQPEQICQSIVRYGDTYILQRANGLLVAGASVEHAGFDRSLDLKTVDRLQKQAAFVMPHLGETTPTEAWNGFRPGSEGLQIGQWHSPRIYRAYGHYRNGILLAPVTAKLLTEEISASLEMR
jgi:glycine oxidase